jgi:hypothetical protein
MGDDALGAEERGMDHAGISSLFCMPPPPQLF